MLVLSIRPADAEPVTIVVPDDYPTIQEAINNADNGDTVFVRNGTYNENVVINRSLTLTGEDRSATIIDGGRRGNIVVVEADNVIVSGFTLRNGTAFGFFLDHTRNSSVVGNNVLSGYYQFSMGVYVYYSPDSKVSGNYLWGNWWGVAVDNSPNTIVSHNKVEQGSMCGIEIFKSNGSTVFANYLEDDNYAGIRIRHAYDTSVFCNEAVDAFGCGIWLLDAGGNMIRDNNLTRNGIGIRLANASGNLIYHNNFINNTYQVIDWFWDYPHQNWTQSINTWDCGYPGGGNYWSNYNGSDLNQGPFQNITGSDGIGDVPYGIDENNTDDYPFMNPHGSLHAIAVDHVRPDRTVLGEGQTAEIDVDAVNCGRFTETFNLTLYANATIINQTEVTLTSVAMKTVTFTWDTTGLFKGNYALTATATPVPGETYILDNNCTCWLIVSMVCDLTGPDGWPDGRVDMRDLGLAASAFGSYPGHQRWNLIADVNQDKKVNMRDIGLVARRFGETDP